MPKTTSPVGLALIQSVEGFVPHVYPDLGVPAIAYGHRLLPGESYPNGISEEAGKLLLMRDLLTRFEPILNKHLPENATQNQFDALASFVYNVQNQPASLNQLLSHGWENVPDQMLRWCHKHDPKTGQVVEDPGLLARRKREAALFKS